jgi:hypothetical protein
MPKKLTVVEFIKKSVKVHGHTYDYSLSDYKGYNIKLIIICSKHGQFKQLPLSHINGKAGCPQCGRNKTISSRQLDTISFIKKAEKIHNYYYDYCLVNYEKSYKKINILCPIHGIYEQTPNSHLRGSGCLACARVGGLNDTLFERHPELKNNQATLYLVKLESIHEVFYKIGITQKNIHNRFNSIKEYNMSIISQLQTSLYDAFCKEQQFLKDWNKYKYEPTIKFGGHTECFVPQLYSSLFG